MKTIKDWLILQPQPSAPPQEHITWLEAIRLEAWRQGMNDAADIVGPWSNAAALIRHQMNKHPNNP